MDQNKENPEKGKVKSVRPVKLLEITHESEGKIAIEFWTFNNVFIGRLIQEKINEPEKSVH